VVEAAGDTAVEIGRAAVFDLADVRPTVQNDAPAVVRAGFPDTRAMVRYRCLR
jgi:hypothetical protein